MRFSFVVAALLCVPAVGQDVMTAPVDSPEATRQMEDGLRAQGYGKVDDGRGSWYWTKPGERMETRDEALQRFTRQGPEWTKERFDAMFPVQQASVRKPDD